MSIFFIKPELTVEVSKNVNYFYENCVNETKKYEQIVEVSNKLVLSKIELKKEDSLVFFTRSDQEYDIRITQVLEKMKKIKNLDDLRKSIYPIALDKEYRTPPKVISDLQTFDIVERLRKRDLSEDNILIIAIDLARKIVADKQPTLCRKKMKFFISHRRVDGEEIAAMFEEGLKNEAEDTFRDLFDIEVGESAQLQIERNLKDSDILLFLHTQKSAESDWINKELGLARLYGIPVIWIMIGENDIAKLKIRPAETPHFKFSNLEVERGKLPQKTVRKIIEKAFETIMNNSNIVFDYLNTLENLLNDKGEEVEVLDFKNMIYRISMERKGYKYYQRKIEQIIQFYGRPLKENDISELTKSLEKLGYKEYEKYGYNYDNAILLSNVNIPELNRENIFVESFSEYISNTEEYLNINKENTSKKNGIIISGAFSDSDVIYQQQLTNAIYAIVQAVFRKNGKIIFGAHPTFQNLIFDIAKIQRPKDYKESVHLYISKLFKNDNEMEEYQEHATVFPIEAVESREKSLTLMRKQMIEDNEAIALICLGGKTKAGGHAPGIDEEIRLAKKMKIPIFLIGSVGGRSAELANEYDKNGWKENINSCSIDENRELMNCQDYNLLANKIIKYIGL